MTFLSNLGLWLAIFEIRGPIRYFIALLLIPSALGVSYIISYVHPTLIIIVLGLHVWLGLITIQRGAKTEQ